MPESMLHMDLNVGDVVDIDNGRIKLVVEEKSGPRARIRFIADTRIVIKKLKKTEVDEAPIL